MLFSAVNEIALLWELSLSLHTYTRQRNDAFVFVVEKLLVDGGRARLLLRIVCLICKVLGAPDVLFQDSVLN